MKESSKMINNMGLVNTYQINWNMKDNGRKIYLLDRELRFITNIIFMKESFKMDWSMVKGKYYGIKMIQDMRESLMKIK